MAHNPSPSRHMFGCVVVSIAACTTMPTSSTPSSPPTYVRADGVPMTADEIDDRVASLMAAAKVTGLGLALLDEDGVRYLKAYGAADVARQRPLGVDTVMYGASLTKGTFAYAVMTLVDEGRVDLDTPIGELLPKPLSDYEKYADLKDDPRWKRWTLRILLSHASGLPNWRWYMPGRKLTILFDPGTRYAYSGEGIQVAQLVLEQGLDIDVNTLMQSRVFDRFGMSRTSMTWRDDFLPDLARGYDHDGKNLGHRQRRSARAAGSMDTTLRDYSSFLAALQRSDGLSPTARAELFKPQIEITSRRQFPTHIWQDTDENKSIGLSYGLGWGLFNSRFGPAFFKEGHDDGWNNYALCLVDGSRCILLLANSSNGESIFLYLVDSLFGQTGLPWAWEGYTPYDHPPPKP